jgi:bifunctional NMN adenylyltransferase/nudix hydrolase
MNTKLGVVIGRFQLPELHAGHRALLNRVRGLSDKVVIFVGAAPFRLTKRNPLPVESVVKSVRANIKQSMSEKDHMVLPLPDQRTDEEWSHRLDTILDSVGYGCDITLYTGRDGFNTHYKGKHKVVVLDINVDVSSTQERKTLKPLHNVPEFRQGVVWAIENQFEKASVCVDIFASKDDFTYALVRKRGEKLWRFPGGFVDPTHTSLEHAVREELYQETGLTSFTDPIYLFSTEIKDWRSSLLTTGWRVYATGQFNIQDSDEIEDVDWFKKGPKMNSWWYDNLVPEHIHLFERYLKVNPAPKAL